MNVCSKLKIHSSDYQRPIKKFHLEKAQYEPSYYLPIENYYAIPTTFKQLVITIFANSFPYPIVVLMALNSYNLIAIPFPHPLFTIYV